MDHSLHAIFPVTLDGQQVHAALDTAAVASTMTTAVARQKFDLDPVGSEAKPDGQEMMSSGASLPFYSHRFGSFAIGDIAFHNTEIEIVPNNVNKALRNIEPKLGAPILNPNQEMQIAIGMHHLARIRFYIAYGERMIYFSAADAN